MPIAFITHPDCLLHDSGSHHPECPERLSAIQDHLIETQLWDLLKHYDAPLAEDQAIEAAHGRAHLQRIREAVPQSGLYYLDEDTAVGPHSLQAALRAAGAAVQAVDLVLGGEVKRAFCSVRPPGHHAEHDRAMGFCLFNNIAIGALHALHRHGLERVAVVDFDVHHGNGTENIFQHDERVLFLSSFQYPFYPFTDINFPAENIIHAPIAAGGGSTEFREALRRRWLPYIDHFKPQLIMVSAGFDGHKEDVMAHLRLDESDYQWITQELVTLAERHAAGRIVSVLEGGYHLPALARSVAVHLRALGGF